MKIENIVFEGGGIRGIAYVGALEVLEERNLLNHVRNVAGSSAGAIFATLYALGYNSNDLFKEVKHLDFFTLRGKKPFFALQLYNLIKKGGLYSSAPLNTWLGNLILKKSGDRNLTFAQLKAIRNISLKITGSDLINSKSHIFSTEETPHYPILKAVVKSASYPLFFSPLTFQGRPMIDGGLLNNYPLRLFDTQGPNLGTIGLRVDSSKEVEASKMGTFESTPNLINGTGFGRLSKYITAIFNALYAYASKAHLNADDWDRTVFIDCLHIKPLDFDIGEASKLVLVEQGRAGMRNYLDWLRCNRPGVATPGVVPAGNRTPGKLKIEPYQESGGFDQSPHNTQNQG